MKKETDTAQRVKAFFLLLLEIYKVFMGTMLILFVPHTCSSQGNSCSASEVLKLIFSSQAHTTITDTWRIVAMACNCFTTSLVFYFYYVEAMRENWCIEYLDINCDKPNNALDAEIEHYPKLKTQMRSLNVRYARVAKLVVLCFILNAVFSGLYLYRHADGLSTTTVFVGYIILVCMKMTRSYTTAMASVGQERCYSAYLTTQRTFNTVDVDHVHVSRDGMREGLGYASDTFTDIGKKSQGVFHEM